MVQEKLLRMEILGKEALQEQLRQKEGQLERHKKTANSYVTEVKLQKEREVGMCNCPPVIHPQQRGTSVCRRKGIITSFPANLGLIRCLVSHGRAADVYTLSKHASMNRATPMMSSSGCHMKRIMA